MHTARRAGYNFLWPPVGNAELMGKSTKERNMPEKEPEGESYYFTYFKKLYDSWESSMSNALELWFKSPIFAKSSERAVQKSQELKSYMYDMMERSLKSRYHPVKSDVDRILKALDTIELKLAELSLKIEVFGKGEKEKAPSAPPPPTSPTPQPKKTKSPKVEEFGRGKEEKAAPTAPPQPKKTKSKPRTGSKKK